MAPHKELIPASFVPYHGSPPSHKSVLPAKRECIFQCGTSKFKTTIFSQIPKIEFVNYPVVSVRVPTILTKAHLRWNHTPTSQNSTFATGSRGPLAWPPLLPTLKGFNLLLGWPKDFWPVNVLLKVTKGPSIIYTKNA